MCRRSALRLAIVALLLGIPAVATAEETSTRLLDMQPFDRVTLNSTAGGKVIDTLLLNLPGRRVPAPFPSTGQLEVRRVSEPSVLYTVPWDAVAEIELFEQLLLAEAQRLTAARDFVAAYEYLDFLHRHYADLPGLSSATEDHLAGDAAAAYSAERYDESFSIVLSLYDLNPRRRGLDRVVQAVSDRLISQHLAARDFAAARSVLEVVSSNFPELQLTNVTGWREKFADGAEQQLAAARRAIETGHFLEARQALRRAIDILPSIAGAAPLMEEINRRAPQVVVGVSHHGNLDDAPRPHDWATARVARLLAPGLLELTDFGAEGGVYACRWGSLESDDSGLQLDVRLNDLALTEGISPAGVARRLLQMADTTKPEFRAAFANLLEQVSIGAGREVNIHWRRSHVRPEALLQLTVGEVTGRAVPLGAFERSADEQTPEVVHYVHRASAGAAANPQTIVEQAFDDEERAIAALTGGAVDLLDRISPWQVDRLRQAQGVVVDSYRLPTIHLLLVNHAKPLLRGREFRRALCYGIDRQQILADIVLGGQSRAGFRVLSAPLPAGVQLSDPVGYAYKQDLRPRPYEPRLAAVLAAVARNALAKSAKTQAEEDDVAPAEAPVEPLLLAYPPNALATTVCQTIRLQLGAIGIPIKLHPLSMRATGPPEDFDLYYVDLTITEPLVDARQLLGPRGRAGSCSPAMSLALQNVDLATNWNEVRTRLRALHQVAFNDLPVIPLWQTVNHFAYRRSLRRVGRSPVTLYQNVADWQITIPGAGR